jgi:hypothetical protein
MFAKSLTLAAAAALTVATFGSTAAEARRWHDEGRYYGHSDSGYYGGRGYRGDRYYGRGYDRRSYGSRGYYGGRGYCRDKGTGGTIIGAIAGGLLGHEIGNGRYDRGDGTTGAIVGAGVGALAGRAIDRDC